MTSAEALFWLADNLDLWRPLAIYVLLGVVLGCVTLAFDSLSALDT